VRIGDALSLGLDAAGCNHPFADSGAGLAGLSGPWNDDLLRTGELNEQVDAIQQGARDFVSKFNPRHHAEI